MFANRQIASVPASYVRFSEPGTIQPWPWHFKHDIADAEKSSPVPRHSGHTAVSFGRNGTSPFPPQTVQVSLLIAPVPRQCAHFSCGPHTRVVPLPLQTQQVESHDMMPKISVPVPWQKAQGTSTYDSFEPCPGACRSETPSDLKSTAPCLDVRYSASATIVIPSDNSRAGSWLAAGNGPRHLGQTHR